jgi:hypothetical protein
MQHLKLLGRICSITVLIASGACAIAAQDNRPGSDRDKRGLIGPVAKVRIETAYFRHEGDKVGRVRAQVRGRDKL